MNNTNNAQPERQIIPLKSDLNPHARITVAKNLPAPEGHINPRNAVNLVQNLPDGWKMPDGSPMICWVMQTLVTRSPDKAEAFAAELLGELQKNGINVDRE